MVEEKSKHISYCYKHKWTKLSRLGSKEIRLKIKHKNINSSFMLFTRDIGENAKEPPVIILISEKNRLQGKKN